MRLLRLEKREEVGEGLVDLAFGGGRNGTSSVTVVGFVGMDDDM